MNEQDVDICSNYHNNNPESVDAHSSIISLKDKNRRKIIEHLHRVGIVGATCDELEASLGLSHQTCSARCSDLLRLNWILRKPLGPGAYEKRKTRSGRNAAVLIHSCFKSILQSFANGEPS